MTGYSRLALTTFFCLTLAGCTSGSDSPSCSFNDAARFVPTPLAMPPTPLAMPPATPQETPGSIWPKFRANVQNTGAVSNVAVSMNGHVQAMFPDRDTPTTGAFIASPVLNAGEKAIYIGSTNNTMYKLNTVNSGKLELSHDTGFNLIASQSITSTALAALRNGQDAVFFGAADGLLYAGTQTGSAQASYWPFGVGGFISASPTMSLYDSTVYVGSENGLFSGVCPNGIVRFTSSTSSIGSSAAIGPDGTVYIGSDDRQLRALKKSGPLKWAFAASAPIVAAPVADVENGTTVIYVADRGGRVYKLDANGLPCGSSAASTCAAFNFGLANALNIAAEMGSTTLDLIDTSSFPMKGTIQVDNQTLGYTKQSETVLALLSPLRRPSSAGTPVTLVVGPISSSPAVTPTRLYVGSDDGNLYACDKETGSITWILSTGGAVVSSPAVAIGDSSIVVVGSMDGNLYFIQDDGSTPPTLDALPLCSQSPGAACRLPLCLNAARDPATCDGSVCLPGACEANQPQPIESSPAIGSDGTVYIGTDGGRVYAIR